MTIFLDDVDRRKFLWLLSDVTVRFDVECWDYCLMSTHYHLCLCFQHANFSEAMQCLNGNYGTWWNARHGRVGHVFQGRFKDQIVQSGAYFATLCRYIARNPVRAKYVADPAKWVWSGYRTIAGLAPNPGFLLPERILSPFGEDLVSQRRGYVRHVLLLTDDETARDEQIRSKERILGDSEFKLSVLGRPERRGAADAIPMRPPMLPSELAI